MSKDSPRGKRNPIVLACQILDCTQAELARRLDCTRAAVSKAKGLGEVSWSMALDLERITGGKITRYQACPKTYGPAPAASPATDEKQVSADAA
jgi:DNA-binding transcriptional regulator YdaS (Cro superfamily)